MIFKLEPNVAKELPLTTYYGITFLSLYVGKTGITSATVKIGDVHIDFKLANQSNKEYLMVNGDPNNNPTYRLMSDQEYMTLLLPDEANISPDEEILLQHYLTYEVPWRNREVKTA